MCNNLLEENKKNEDHDGLLFDIFACKLGTGKMSANTLSQLEQERLDQMSVQGRQCLILVAEDN